MTEFFRVMATESGVAAEELAAWIDRRWLLPDIGVGGATFNQADRARVGMIVEFRRDLAIDDEAMPVVLGLVDRLHAARAALQTVLEAVASLPSPQQDAVLRQIRATPGSWAPDAYQSTAK